MFYFFCLVVSISAINFLLRLASKMTCHVSSGMLNPTHIAHTHSATIRAVLEALCFYAVHTSIHVSVCERAPKVCDYDIL